MYAEYDRAKAIHGPSHASAHEAYAVMLEERQEADVEAVNVKIALDYFWNATKKNEDTIEYAQNVMGAALVAAAEYIQVAAMAYKATIGYGEGKA